MTDRAEAQKGLQFLKEIFEAERVLKLSNAELMRGRFAYFLEVVAFDREWNFVLSGETLSDLPQTPTYQKSAQLYARELARRLRNPLYKGFFCKSRRALELQIEWPIEHMPGRAASALSVSVRDLADSKSALCYVVVTHMQSVFDLKQDPFLIQSGVVNSIRVAVDDGKVLFYPPGLHPVQTQPVDLLLKYPAADRRDINDFLRGKVVWLGFRVSDSLARVWLPDSWDAAYLGCGIRDLKQQSEFLAANNELILDETHEFASIGNELLKKADQIEKPQSADIMKNTGWDVFICHASEDKQYVEPLVAALEAAGIRVWFDKTVLEWGDDLRQSIDRGLIACRFGIVVFSKAFLRKKRWTEYELSSLFALEQTGEKRILPIWHGVTHEDLLQYGPAFADRLAKISSTDTYDSIVASLRSMLGK